MAFPSRMQRSDTVDRWLGSTGVQASGQSVSRPNTDQFELEAMPHMNDLYRTATRLLGDRSRAEDVVQEVYLQAWKSYHRFESGTNCRAWLYKILFHCVNHHRRKWFRFPLLKEAEGFLETNLVQPPVIPDYLTDEDILMALDKIPSDYRTVVLLVDVEEFAYKDDAEIIDIPIGTVMSRLSRGRKALRVLLEDVARAYGVQKQREEAL
jgi:RNA polymerase sigma-70 factor, ECF subfamily